MHASLMRLASAALLACAFASPAAPPASTLNKRAAAANDTVNDTGATMASSTRSMSSLHKGSDQHIDDAIDVINGVIDN